MKQEDTDGFLKGVKETHRATGSRHPVFTVRCKKAAALGKASRSSSCNLWKTHTRIAKEGGWVTQELAVACLLTEDNTKQTKPGVNNEQK